jgi:hypothetical protein
MKILLITCAIFVASLRSSAHPGVGIVMDSKRNVFYTDLTHVWKIDTEGKKSIAVRNVHTHELYIDEHDNLFGEHLWYDERRPTDWAHFVWRLSSQGQYQKIIPDTEGFRKEYSFVRDYQGNMYWADRENACQKIIRRDKNDRDIVLNVGCLKNIRWMYATPEGIVYVMDGFDLKQIDGGGVINTIALHLEENTKTNFKDDDPHLIMGLHANREAEVFVAVYGGGKVKKVKRGKTVVAVFESNVQWLPTGVLSAPDGDLWILECSPTNAVRVERFTKDNRRIVY